MVSLLLCQVRDVSALARLCSLQTLTLDGTEVTEGSLELLASHQALSCLSLGGIPVASGDEALRIVSGVNQNTLECATAGGLVQGCVHTGQGKKMLLGVHTES